MSGPIDKNQKNIKSTKNVDNMEDYDQNGQAKLYSPDYAIKINTKDHLKNSDYHNQNSSSMVGIDNIKNKLGLVKERLMEKLVAASVPSDALENVRILIESTIKDFTSAAQGLTVEALHKIKFHLAHILPALSPSLTSKMVDDAAKETMTTTTTRDEVGTNEMVGEKHNQEHKGKLYTSLASTFYSNSMLLPISKL